MMLPKAGTDASENSHCTVVTNPKSPCAHNTKRHQESNKVYRADNE